MIKCFSIICLMFTTFALSACDYGLAFFGNKTFTVRFHTPPGLKMYVGTGWSSDSFLCREISFGSSSGFTRGGYSKVVDAEENDGEWLAEVPIELWHPFCSWRHEALAIGFSDEKSVGKEGNTLAFAYLEPNSPENPTKGNAVSLVCDRRNSIYKHFNPLEDIDEARKTVKSLEEREELHKRFKFVEQITETYSLQCKELGSERNVASTINIAFLEGGIGDFHLKESGNQVFFFSAVGSGISFYKKINLKDTTINSIFTDLENQKHWKVEKHSDTTYKIFSYINYGDKNPVLEKEMYLSDAQLKILASKEQWELPDFVK